MMTYTRSAIGLLTRQYRSVLRKCFLINCGLFALGAVGAVSVTNANAAVPTPTLNDMNTKAESFTTTSHYTLTTTQDTNTNFLLLDNGSGTLTQYWYTPAEDTAEKNNILNYLAGVALTTEGADEEHYVFKQGTTYYKFDMSKPRPASSYTLTESASPAHWKIVINKNYDLVLKNRGTGNENIYYKWSVNPDGTSRKFVKGTAGANDLIVKANAGSGNTNVYYKWTTDAKGNLSLTSTGASSSDYDFIAKYNSAVGTVQTGNYSFPTISPTSLINRATGVVRNTGTTSYENYLFLDNASSGTINQTATGSKYSFVYGGGLSNSSTITSITSDFVGNSLTTTSQRSASSGTLYSSSIGGAIGNYSSSGSKVSIGDITGDFIGNYVNAAVSGSGVDAAAYGGAIGNSLYGFVPIPTIGNINGDFIGNYVSTAVSASGVHAAAYGGAISNDIGIIGNITGDFINNYTFSTSSSAYGGAIVNTGQGKISSITGDFINNYASGYSAAYGGAISGGGTDSVIGNINGNFINNYASATSSSAQGGAIANSLGTIGNITGDFINNYAFSSNSSVSGGAIYNINSRQINSITGDFIGNYATSTGTHTYDYVQGGAIFNAGTITITSDFINNYASSVNSFVRGGAINNQRKISILGNFTNNYAFSSKHYVVGGAIVNLSGTISTITGDFINNYAKTSSSTYKAYGGAIYSGNVSSNAPSYNANSIITLSGNTFTGNYVDNNGTITPNSIYNAGIINIANGKTVTINDGYDGLNEAVLNIGSSSIFNLNGTEVTHNIGILNNAGTINLADNVTTDANGLITGSTGNINIGNSAAFNINENNGTLQTDSLGVVSNSGTMNWNLDVDLVGTNSDKITVSSLSGTQSIIITAINLTTGTGSDEIKVTLTSDNTLKAAYKLADDFDIATNITKATGVTYTVNSVSYDNTSGILTFNRAVTDNLVTWIAKTDETDKVYTIAEGGEIVAENLGTLVNNLKVKGNGETTTNKVIGGNFAGVSLGATAQTLELEDIAEWSGFTGNAVNNGTSGTVKIKNVNFSNNATADISNAGTLEFTGTNSLSKITGDGAMEVKSGTTTVGSLAQGTLTVTSGELKNNGASTVGGGSNAGTISGTGSLSNSGAFTNTGTISQAVSHSGTGTNVFTNSGTISGAVTNSGVFANNSSITGAVTNSGTFNNTGTISGAVTNTGTMTSAAEKMTGTVANNGTGVLNLSGALAKNISGTGTTNVDSALALNSGAGIAGTLAMDTSDTVTVSSGAITEHTIGEIKGTGNIALDINYGETITSDKITVTNDTQAATLKITALNETGTRAANFEKQILFGTNGNTKLDVSGLSGWNGSTDKEAEVALTSGTIAYNENYGTHKWTETTALTVIGSAEGLYDTLKYTTTISNDRFDPKAENLTVINQYSGTGSDDRKINFAGIQEAAGGTYTMKASTSLGETKAGKMTLDGEKNTTTKALTVVNLNGNAGYNLTKATELVLDEVKLTNASGNVITASNDSAKVTLNDAYVDGNIVKTGSNKMTVETSGNTTLNGNTSNVSVSNSNGTLTNNGTITGDVTNSGILNSSADNITGTITNNGTFNLSGDLSKDIDGTGTTVLQSTTSAVAADREISGTLNANGKTISMQDSAFETLTVNNLTGGNSNITINAKASTEDSDKISISSGTNNASALTITGLTLDTSGLTEGTNYTKTMSVVADKTTGVSLKFDDNLDLSDYNQTGVTIADKTGTDSVTDKEVAWNETFGAWKQSRKKDTKLEISGTNMVYTVTNYDVGSKTYTSNSEGLKELNQFNAGTDTKTFNAASDGSTHTIIEDLGNTVGKVSIDGKGGTLDFDDHKGFVMGSGTEVSLKDVTAKNADGLADVKAGATLNLEGVTLEDNGVLQNAGTINLKGSNSIDSIIAGTATTATLNVNSDWDMDTTVTGHTVNVNGKKLTVNAGKLVASDSLNAKDGSEIEIGSNKVNLDQVKFESGSKLNLKVDSLNNFGAVNANNITIENGANLSATLAQGIVKIGQKETLQLLKADNSNFNNFADSFDNKMYHFEKADKNGAYNISQVKTAEEVVEETGGTATEARAAEAWVDGDQFNEGTKAAKVANALADLAQNEPKEFTKALSVVAPQEAPKAQSELTELSDKLLLTVGKYLSNQDIGGLSSGDALQDATIWAKGYYGESKLSNHGKVKGFDSKNKGVIAGFDKKLNKAVKVGAGFQYNDSDVDAYHRDVEVDSLVGFVYGEYRPSKWFVSGVASFGKADYDEEKHTLGSKVRDNYSANVYSLQALTGYDFKYVTPEIGARYYRIKRHGYEDNIGQSVSGKDMDILRGVFGLRSSYEFGMFKPEVYAGITYDFVSDKDNALVSLPNGSSYTVDGKRLKRFGTEFSLNVTAQVTDNTKIGAGYEGKFREHYQDHTGMISVKYEF
ncbi:MAG: hypothetical protein J6N49_01590 [Alphaproteobacteria bacterium]|nr:hypothetical protein [Alphaproteobacteria bacterium]